MRPRAREGHLDLTASSFKKKKFFGLTYQISKSCLLHIYFSFIIVLLRKPVKIIVSTDPFLAMQLTFKFFMKST